MKQEVFSSHKLRGATIVTLGHSPKARLLAFWTPLLDPKLLETGDQR